jgi:hypothetical protein
MALNTILKFLKLGKHIRRTVYSPSYALHLEYGAIVDNCGRPWNPIITDFEAKDWEIVP